MAALQLRKILYLYNYIFEPENSSLNKNTFRAKQGMYWVKSLEISMRENISLTHIWLWADSSMGNF